MSLSWMPLTHDMGLIGFHIYMFANRMQVNLMSTELFIRRPLLWLTLATRKRATILCSPNFGYRHYLKVLADRAIEGLDLSSVRVIFNGAEPISVDLCEEFLDRLAACAAGARRDVSGLWPRGSRSGRELSARRQAVLVQSRSIVIAWARASAWRPCARTTRTPLCLMAVGSAIPHLSRSHRRR